MIERKCPSCGAMVPFRSSISLLAVCPYCRALTRRDDLDLEKLGVSAQLQPDGTPLQVSSRGAFKGDPFEAVGRVQLKTPAGFWNEWFLAFTDGRQGWLGEAQGTYAVSFELKETAPARKDLALGSAVTLGGRAYEVRELVEASYLAAEGELPFKPPLGETAPSADLISAGGWFATIDYSEEPPCVFAGQYQDFDSLELANLKVIEGWA
jgi:hypothetical protein